MIKWDVVARKIKNHFRNYLTSEFRGYYRTEDGVKIFIRSNGTISVDLKDPQTKEIFINKMVEHHNKYEVDQNGQLRRRRQRLSS